jgi:hypothetical protein
MVTLAASETALRIKTNETRVRPRLDWRSVDRTTFSDWSSQN